MSNKPFQQFAPDKPQGATIARQWFRRNIVLDHIHLTIYIQVMWDGSGELSQKEFKEIRAGMFWDYIPAQIVDEIRHGIASGYQVKPFVLAGSPVGELHTVLQMLDIQDTHHVTMDPTILKPVSEPA